MSTSSDRTFHEFFRAASSRLPRKLALIADGTPHTYEELWEKSGWLAKSFLQMGVEPGDRLGLWLPNSMELILAFLATARTGAIGVSINTRFRKNELSYILPHSGISILICPEEFLGFNYYHLLKEVAPDLRAIPSRECTTSYIPSLRKILITSTPPPSGAAVFGEILEEGKFLPSQALQNAEKTVQPDDTYILMYTSGSTSTPKGVLLKHSSCTRKPSALAKHLGLGPRERFYTAMPLCHAAGLFSGWWLAVAVGAPFFTHSRFSPETALECLSKERITVERSFPTLVKDQLNFLIKNPDGFDLSSLRTGLASSLSADIFKDMESHLGPHQFVNNYGFTEATGVVCLSHPTDPPEIRWGKMGKPLKGMEVKVSNPETGRPYPANQEGEIMVKGWAMMKGYHDPSLNVTPAFDSDGWFHSGDLGILDREGNLTYLGRLRERLRVGGENVSPEEVGIFLRRHPAVEAAEVFGIPDGRLGEVPAVAVRREVGSSLSESELIDFCRDRIAGFKIPRHIYFVETMPLNSSNKINRKKLRQDLLDMLNLDENQ